MMMMVEVGGWVWAVLVMVGVWTTQSHAHFGSCEDHSPNCPSWAFRGMCNTRRVFMYQNCPVSCNVCLDPECVDRASNCALLLLAGNCQTNREQMLRFCRHTCGACRIPGHAPSRSTQPFPPASSTLTKQGTIVNPDFECGRGKVIPTSRSGSSGSSGRSGSSSGSSGSSSSGRNSEFSRIVFPDEAERLAAAAAAVDQTKHSRKSSTMVTTRRRAPENVDTTVQGRSGDISVQDAFCGATPISDHFLLTAAHCVFHPDFSVRTVRLGELDFGSENEANSKPVDYAIEQIIVHPDFDPDSRIRYNDVALLQTVEQIAFNDLVFPYCVSARRPGPNTTVTGSGFGFVNSTHQSPVLQEADLRVVDAAECENIYRGEDHEGQLRLLYPDLLQGRDIMCASYPERSACEGDSGGPLFVDDEGGRRFLVGIVGSGVSCRQGSGASILPGLFVSVADHIDFIDSVLYGNFL